MLFNSFIFVLFFIIVYTLYLGLSSRLRLQNLLLLFSSYLFYGWWDWRFLSLLGISTLADYLIGRKLGDMDDSTASLRKKRKALLALSVTINLGLLGVFKYFNFFVQSASDLLRILGMEGDFVTLKIVLPVGISFYTFQTMSYTIDVYRKRMPSTRSLVDFAVFVSFFPQLVAGPIERAMNLIPQVQRLRKPTVEQINVGIYLILWGYFKKVVVADNCSKIANLVFNNYASYQGLDLFIGVLAFAVQIYGDFSGYSDIARGLAKIMGFDIMVNFRLPYFAMNPSDFWNRWHISLSSWLRDYLYITLGGNKRGALLTYRNLSLTMLLGGLWHGAAWNFVIWGAFHGAILILYRLIERKPAHENPWGGDHSYFVAASKMTVMFALTLYGWVLFRCRTVPQILHFTTAVSFLPTAASAALAGQLIFFSLPLFLVQLHQYVKNDLLALMKLSLWIRVPLYGFFLVWILIFGVRESIEFIYFQF